MTQNTVIEEALTDNNGLTKLKERDYDPETLPIPTGWHILVEPVAVEQVSAGGIILVDEHKKAKEVNRYTGRVVAMGSDCYTHPNFSGKRWCEVGDWVLYSAYTGLGAKVKDRDGEIVSMRFIHDKAVVATTRQPAAMLIDV